MLMVLSMHYTDDLSKEFALRIGVDAFEVLSKKMRFLNAQAVHHVDQKTLTPEMIISISQQSQLIIDLMREFDKINKKGESHGIKPPQA